jgi:mono/diheme cytochrome c family protein
MNRGVAALARLLGCLALMIVFCRAGAADPHADYMLHCQGCHGPDGGGVTQGAPPFGSDLGKFLRTPRGREYLVRVPGVAQSELDDTHTAALLNWLLTQFAADQLDPAQPFSANEVARYRARPLLDVKALRQQLLNPR